MIGVKIEVTGFDRKCRERTVSYHFRSDTLPQFAFAPTILNQGEVRVGMNVDESWAQNFAGATNRGTRLYP
jgi:hypothetical protein